MKYIWSNQILPGRYTSVTEDWYDIFGGGTICKFGTDPLGDPVISLHTVETLELGANYVITISNQIMGWQLLFIIKN